MIRVLLSRTWQVRFRMFYHASPTRVSREVGFMYSSVIPRDFKPCHFPDHIQCLFPVLHRQCRGSPVRTLISRSIRRVSHGYKQAGYSMITRYVLSDSPVRSLTTAGRRRCLFCKFRSAAHFPTTSGRSHRVSPIINLIQPLSSDTAASLRTKIFAAHAFPHRVDIPTT